MECEPPSPRSQNRFTDFCDNEEPAIGPSPPRRVVLGEIAPNGAPMGRTTKGAEGGKKPTKRPAFWTPEVSLTL